ncbi:MAG: hypothetical protein VX155_08620, partial [Planctomycetota bacterium]|nr:hypothetical protein [Planctomycetota bacterium]
MGELIQPNGFLMAVRLRLQAWDIRGWIERRCEFQTRRFRLSLRRCGREDFARHCLVGIIHTWLRS